MSTEKQYTVLLIDDSAEDRAAYCRYLQRGSSRAYRILEADSAAAGLDLYQRSRPDAVLLDYSLPDMDVLDVLAVLRQNEKQRTPVLMITGQGHEAIAVQAIKSGAEDYLIKGNLTANELCRTLDRAIEQFQLRQQLQQQQQQQHLISTIALSIRQSLQLEGILETTVTEVQQFLNADRVMIYKFRPDMSGTIITESVLPGWSVTLNQQVQDTCFQHNRGGNYRTGKSWAIANIYQANLTPCHLRLLEQFEVKANLVAPILVRGELWGLLIAHQCSDFRQWQSSDLDLLEALVVQIAIAIQQATAYQQAKAELEKRQQIEVTLRKSEQRYATLTELSPVGIFQTDAEGHCLYANERWCQIAGLTPAEAAGFGWANGIHLDDRELVSTEWYAAVQANRPFRLEYRFQNVAGQITWVFGQAIAERGVSGEIVGYVGTVTDISDRKQAEQALKVQRDFNLLIAEISSRFVDISPNNLDTEIERTLQLIGEATQVDTSYMIKFSEGNGAGTSLEERTLRMTHEWAKSGCPRQITLVQNAPLTLFPWANTKLLNRETVHVPWTADAPAEAAIDQVGWRQFNLSAVLVVPLIQKSTVAGVMGFASFSHAMNWDTETIRLLQVMAQTIANAQERTQNEQRLYVSEERLRLALAAVNQGLYDLDLRTGEVIVTPEYATMLGYDPATFQETNAKWIERLHPDDRERVANIYQAYVAGNLPQYKVEFRQRTQAGKWKWILSLGKIVDWDAARQPLRMLGTHTDINDRKQAEAAIQQLNRDLEQKVAERTAALQASEATNRAMLEAVPDLLLRLGRDGTCLAYIQPSVKSGTFLPIHNDLSEVLPATLLQQQLQVIATAIETRELQVYEHQFLKQGHIVDEEIRIAALNDSEVLAIVRDISDRKQFETSLMRYERIISSTKDGIALLDRHYTYQVANQAYLTWCNKSQNEVIGHSVRDVLGSELFDNFIRPRLDQCLAGQTVQYEKWFDYPNVVPQFLSVTYTPYLDVDQTIVGMIVSLRDMTDRKQAEEQLRKSDTHLKTAQRIAKLGSWEFDLRTGQITWSEEVFRIFGRDPAVDTPNFEELQQLIHLDDRDPHQQAIQTAIETVQPYEIEYRLYRPDGAMRHLQARGVPIADATDQIIQLVGTVLDITDRKQVEQELTHSRDLREAIFNESADALFLVDPDTLLILDCNQRAVDLFGMADKAELIGIQGNTLQRHQFFDQELAEITTEMRTKGFWSREIEYVTRQGNFFWGNIAAKPIVVAGRTMNLVRVTDISDRKRAEDALRESEHRFATLSEAAPVALFRFDITGSCIYVNDRWSEMTGRPVEEGLGWGWTKTIHSQDYERVSVKLAEWLPTCKAGDLYRNEARTLRPDGSIRWHFCQMLPETDASGTKIGYVGTLTDITDRKQAEAQLQSLSDRLSLALKSGAIAIWDWNVSENILTWDDRMYELYGITPNQFTSVYDAWASSLHPDDRPLTEAAMQQALAGEKDYDPEFRVVHPDGTIRFLKAAALVQRDEQGEPQHMIGINFDITDRKQAEIELMQTSAQLEASNKELEAFAYSVSHDLRSPLRAIDGFSRALLEDYGDQFGEEGKDYFDRIRHNVGRMGTLIDDLLNLSRVSRSEMQYSAVNLSTLMQEQLHELQALEPERQVIVVVAPEAIVSADATLMRVVISNLLQNAWKFTSHHATAHIEFGIMQREEQSIYFIRDDGAGFDMAYAKMLFGVFQRLHNTHEFPGTGIGLATVQRAIHRHGGRVWAEGAVEQGATLYFTVPHSHLQTGA